MDLEKYIRKSEKTGPSFALRNKGKQAAEDKPKTMWKSTCPTEKRCLQCGKAITKEDTCFYQRFCCEVCKQRYLTGV
ncbi:MAG: hypothetical protein NTW59_05190 [Candidatus Diapherotrites archaeon]|nr:hypothetical protein [Candidatus Diapherotrites archaeon]